jgi:two-component system, chemotaxis family, response regulator Rcp1
MNLTGETGGVPNRVSVLLIEDNPADVTLMRHALMGCTAPFDLEVAKDGEEASSRLFGPEARLPQLIILDLNLPRIDGHTILARLRKSDSRTAHIPVVVVSSSQNPADIEQSYLLGANAYMSKPANLDEFENHIRQICQIWIEPLSRTRR